MRRLSLCVAIAAGCSGGGAPASAPSKASTPLVVQLAAPPVRHMSLDAPRAMSFDDALVRAIAARPEVDAVAGAVPLEMPARGLAVLDGNDVDFEVGGFCDGIDPAYVAGELGDVFRDFDAGAGARAACTPGRETGCDAASYCDEVDRTCHRRVPVIVSPLLLELYNGRFASEHHLAPIADPRGLIAAGKTRFDILLGRSIVSGATPPRGVPHKVGAVVVGVSRAARSLGITVPVGYVRRWSAELGVTVPPGYDRVSVRLRDQERLEDFATWLRGQGHEVDRVLLLALGAARAP